MISALVLIFPGEDESRLDELSLFWVPEEDARKREHRDRVPFVYGSAMAQDWWILCGRVLRR